MGDPLTPQERGQIDKMHDLVGTGTFYELLEVSEDADPREIQQAYYSLSRSWHPDRFFRREMGDYGQKLEIVFANITRAYKTLSDEARRKEYDRSIEGRPKRRAEAAAEGAAPRQTPRGDRPPTEEHVQRRVSKLSAAAREDRAKRAREKMKAKLKQRMGANKDKAQEYFKAGMELAQSGDMIKAASALHLALQCDPDNVEYKREFERAKEKSRDSQYQRYLDEAQSAANFGNARKALAYFKKAAEYDPQDARIFYTLGNMVRDQEKDDRAALNYLRKAVEKDPRNVEYRMALGNLYTDLKMALNAKREYQAVLEIDPKHKDAKKRLGKGGLF